MTLGRLVLAWVPVAVWFGLVVGLRWMSLARRGMEAMVGMPSPLSAWFIGWLLVEAAAVTLFASLWFDSLGSGGWWVLFALVGFLVGVTPRMLVAPFPGPVRRLALLDGAIDVVRYVGAGALLAWRLG